MTREEAIEVLKKSIDNTIEMTVREWEEFDKEVAEAIDMAINALAVLQQYKWERDVAIEQLEEYGIGFAEKKRDMVEVVRCKECKHYSLEGETTQFGWCNALEMPTDEQRFCSDGERREG